ncbi:hypothetical protein ALP8811_02477 [Aliiroseovarius pelagivivens]|uniref:Glycosyltransferase 2-like domain-containing protein n=1 Tax=Aliiroseovarius pelagivivens TaxID=1639690 RepID=A0A2R8ARF6_9RHOB|nr:glycosyltransferase family 2 protein [Aliiroseovarius pelagivivens]SPF78550.1 hypothetical protein ALP8811_02477 [Aliiroseovarius pelagivivens]
MLTADFRDEIAKDDSIDSFSVILCARESLPVLRVFVEHYQRAGAEQIFLYIDDTKEVSDAVAEGLKPYAFVTVKGCDEAFWKEVYPDEDVPSLQQKQFALRDGAIALNKSDWLFFCDADEFIAGDRPIGMALAQLPESFPGVRLQNSEAVWGPDDDISQPFGCTYERFRFSRKQRRTKIVPMLVYGKDWREMVKGTAGHSLGKHFLRRGAYPEDSNSHYSKFDGKRIPYFPSEICEQHNWRVVHFDAISLERWQEKWGGRLSGRTNNGNLGDSRIGQGQAADRAFQTGKSQNLFRRYYKVNTWQKFMLMRLGLLRKT